jgi:hypothetical protein
MPPESLNPAISTGTAKASFVTKLTAPFFKLVNLDKETKSWRKE